MKVTRFQVVCLLTFALCFAVGAGNRVSVPGLIATESSGNASAQGDFCKKTGTYLSLGLGQMSRAAWADVNQHLGWSKDYDSEVLNGQVNELYTDAYINRVLPKYLAHYGIPDSEPARLVAYKYGIGRIRTLYREYQAGWTHACRNRLGRQWTVYEEVRDGEEANHLEVHQP